MGVVWFIEILALSWSLQAILSMRILEDGVKHVLADLCGQTPEVSESSLITWSRLLLLHFRHAQVAFRPSNH